MNSVDSFSADYKRARTRFREAAASAGGALESLPHPEKGPDGADLYTDVARFGSLGAQKMLVLISGTHGVEGFCGSGAQVDFLRRGEAAKLPHDVGLLMIHAINPYGFAWLRRVTHENIDLNRNWIDFKQPLPKNPTYTALSGAICPKEWTDSSRAAANAVLAEYAAREGALALNQAMSGGQYEHPTGIFYGGTAPSWSRTTQTRIFQHYLGQVSAVGIIDYHTGLGPWGFAEQIATAARDSTAFHRASRWYGAAVKSTVDGTSAAARIGGDGLTAATALLPGCTVTAIALEVGTLPHEEVRLALRADAWLHAHGDLRSPEAKKIKSQIRAAYYGDADDWKGMVAGQSLLACRQALAGLGTEAV